MPIGPALPPHLAHLARASTLSDDEGSEAGPSLPRSTTPPLPPQNDDDDDDDDDYGPALPPHLAAARSSKPAGPQLPSSSAGPSRSPGPKPTTARPSYADDDDDDEDDDVIGPMPVADGAAQEKSAVQEFLEREERWAKEREEASKPKKLEREEWMLVPPSAGVLANVDPLRKRPSTFARSSAAPNTDQSVWTETPAEKAQRIADEVAGIKRVKPGKRLGSGADREAGEDEAERQRKRRKEEEVRREVERHNKEQRGQSLLQKHQTARGDKKDTTREDVIWDRERDMGVTGRLLSDQERQQKIRDARGLNDRFGHSARGAYDI